MSKIILTILSVLILIIGALLVIPSFMDWSQYKDQIKTQVANATGYEVEINGELRAAFLPYPHVILNNVGIDSADVEGPFAFQGQVEKASVALELLPLLSGDIAVSDVSLISPQIAIQEQDYTQQAETEENDETSAETGDASSRTVQIERLYLENAKLSYKPLQGEATQIALPELELQADTLYGPYEYDGELLYNDMNIAFDGSAGEYSKTEAMPVTVNINGDAFSFGFSGVADLTKEVAEFQGELNAEAQSLQNLVTKAGGSDLPIKDQSFALKGLLNGSQNAFKLDNGTFSFGKANGTAALNVSNLDGETKVINAGLTFSNALNLDNILKASTASSSNGNGGSGNSGETYRFLPETMEIPSGINATLEISAPKIQYKGQSFDNAVITAGLENGQVSGTIKANNLPGGGNINMSASLTAESTSRNGANGSVIFSNPALAFNGSVALNSLKTVAADWLQLTSAETFNNPQMPKSASGQLNGRIQGPRASLSSSQFTVGQYDMSGLSLAYQNAAEPTVNLSVNNFEGATIKAEGTLDQSQGVKVSVAHPNAANFIKVFKPDLDATPNMQQSFSFNGTVFKNDDVIRVSGMNAKVGNIDATGNLSINNGGDIPDIKAEIAFGKLDTRALLTGKKSTATSGGTNASASSTSAPWTRDAIDTSFLRSINLDLDAKAQQLVHGTWLITSPVIDVEIRNGVMDINKVAGGLFDGSVDMSGRVEAKNEGQPLSASAKINAQKVDLNRLVQSALSQNQQRVSGTGSFNMELKTSGLSSSALIYALNGDGRIETSALTIYGIDLAKVTEAISDESLTDATAAFRGGRTPFEAINHPLTIREGTMPVNDLALVSPTATITSNGDISFARWQMNLMNTVDFREPYEDVPSIEMAIKGPLNAPQQNIASDVLRSFIMGKYGDKIQKNVDKLLGDKLKDTPAAGMINNLLGLPQKQPKAAPQQQQEAPVETQPETEPAPANDNTATQEPVSTSEPAPVDAEPDAAPQREQSPEEQMIRGLIDQFAK